MIHPINHLPPVIRVGIQAESGVEAIGFDLSPWMTRWPGMTFAVWPTRPGESASYIAADTELVGNVLYWYPNAADTEKEGAGTVEVVGIGGGKCKSSGVIDTLVKKTSLDVTQETPDPMKPWAEKVLQAANEVKAQVDVGTGAGLYLVNQRKDDQSKVDRTAEEIKAAVSSGKTVLLRAVSGDLYSLCVNLGPNLYFTNVRPGLPSNLNSYGLTVKTAVMTEGDGIQFRIPTNGTLSPNPYKLKLTGAVEAEYDGRSEVTVEIPAGGGSVPDPGKAHMQLVSNAIGEAEWDRRECYTSRPVVFPYQMAVDAYAPSASIYATDGGADTGVRWVKVSDYAPAQSEVMGRATVFTSEYETTKVEDENILDSNERGYLIAREWESTSTSGETRIIRTVFGVVCLEGGYVAHGHPGIKPVADYSSTISEPGLYLPVGIDSTVTAYGFQFDEYVQQLDEKYIPDSIARVKDLENVIIPELPEQVTDEHINALIDAKLSAFGTQNILAEQTLPGEDDDGDGVNDNFYVTGAWDTVPVVGSTYDVYYNGTKYPCEAVAMPEDAALAPGAMAMGNLADMGLDGIVGNPDAPFAMVCLHESMGGIVGMLMPMDGATAVTLSIRSANVGYYYYDGSRTQIVTIDQLKADLGLGGGDTTTDVFYTADGQIFTDVNGAVMHIQKGEQ
jgi:hypothetical protein